MNNTTRAGILALTLTVGLSGCAVLAPATQSTEVKGATPAPTIACESSDDSSSQARPTEPLSAAAATRAATTATTLMRLYARPGVDADAWLNALYPFLTQGAAAALAHTDPVTIPAHTVTANPTLLPVSTADGAVVDVPTDAGTYRVLLLRSGGGWAADQITPPPGG
jgi:uncharacterized protein YceK